MYVCMYVCMCMWVYVGVFVCVCVLGFDELKLKDEDGHKMP